MARFHTLKVREIERETRDAVSIVLDVPAALAETFRYIQGQYVTVKVRVNGEELRRSYSICSSPATDQELRIAVKKVKDGRVSGFFNQQLKPGDKLEVMPPMGNFYTKLDPAHSRRYVLFAGGSGITPMISILKTILHIEHGSQVQLFYGNEDHDAIIFREHLERLVDKHSDRLTVYHILNAPPSGYDEKLTGMMTTDKVDLLLRQFVDTAATDHYFICGPQVMMNNVEQTLKNLAIPAERIHLEYFTVEIPGEKKQVQSEGPTTISKVTVRLDGVESQFDLAFNGQAILDAALDANLDVPFACKGAVCCTCKARLIEGSVEMEMNYALSESEVEDGFILTCQSHPTSPVVVVDYDQG